MAALRLTMAPASLDHGTSWHPTFHAPWPYLVPITFELRYPYRESAYLDLWAERHGSNGGILLLTDSGPRKLRDDLSWAFQVADEDGNDFFFRFYDPRVLRSFAKACTIGDAKNLFGTIRLIFVEGESRGAMLVCQVESEGVAVQTADLTSVPSGMGSC